MLKIDDLADIDALGEESDDSSENLYGKWDEDDDGDEFGTKKKYSVVPILQMAVCAAILLTLIYFKFAKPEQYQEAVNWYKTEAAQEIELPKFEKEQSKPESEAEKPVAGNQNQSLERI